MAYSAQTLEVKLGTITDFKADVLVNVIANVTSDLSAAGIVSKSFLTAGGHQLQKRFEKEPPLTQFGKDVAVTKACGSLKANYIYHAFVRPRRDATSDKLLHDMICTCLKKAVYADQTSIAFPTVGCGRLGYKPATVADCFSRAVQETFSSLKVFVIAYEEEIYNEFITVIRQTAAAVHHDVPECTDETPLRTDEKVKSVCEQQPQQDVLTSTTDDSDELVEHMKKVLPRVPDAEIKKIVQHLLSLGVNEPSDIAMVSEEDLRDHVKRIHIKKILASAGTATGLTATSLSESMLLASGDLSGIRESTESGQILEQPVAEPQQLLTTSPSHATPEHKIVNIVLLGETGVGKSTSINSFGMYLRFGSLDEGEGAEPEDLFMIPLQFDAIDSKTYESRQVAVGAKRDANEFHEKTGDSVTQDPKVHTLRLPNLTLNIIDTPGIGDTSGVEQDATNVQKILDCLTNFEHLNAICLLLKPHQARLEDRFKYCLTGILRNLHEDAKKNIVICFTNGKAVNYEPGDTVALLKAFMSGDEILKQIEMSPKTVYFLENEPVRYLAKFKTGGQQSDRERKSAAECWENTSEQMFQMFDHITSLPVHLVIGMTSINDARRVIGNIIPILLDVTRCIVNNLKSINSKRIEVQQLEDQIKRGPDAACYDIKEALYRDDYQVEVEALSHSITVCTSSGCSECVNGRYEHTKVCDPHCVWAPSLRLCIAMDWWGNCKNCGCSHSQHEWTSSRRRVVQTKVLVSPESRTLSKAAMDQMVSREKALPILRNQLDSMDKEKNDYIGEKDAMLEICAKLSVFLQQNAMMRNDETNDFMHYLRKQMDCLQNDPKQDQGKKEAMEDLKQMADDYKSKKDAVLDKGEKYSSLAVKQMINDLFKLPIKGKEIQRALTVFEEAKAAAIKASAAEEHVVTKISKKVFGWLGFGKKK